MIIFDLHYIAWRSHFANPNISHEGNLTGAIHGVIQQTCLLARKFHDSQVIFAGDSVFNKRKEIYPFYKKRDKIIEEQDQWFYDQGVIQIQKLKNMILPFLGFKNIFEYNGYEADDVIASLVHNYDFNKKPIVITNDEDLFQLLEYCNLYSPIKEKLMTDREFQKTYGIKPSQWVMVKALVGCSSDKVPGVPGIGNKRAISYIQNTINKNSKAYQSILEFRKNKELFSRNLKLVKLPFPNCPTKYTIKKDKCYLTNFIKICEKYNFQTLLSMYKNRWKEIFVK